MLCFLPTVFHITPYTSYITSRETDKISGPSLVKSFSLDGIKMLHYRERINLASFIVSYHYSGFHHNPNFFACTTGKYSSSTLLWSRSEERRVGKECSSRWSPRCCRKTGAAECGYVW